METEILDTQNHDSIRNVQYATFLDRFLAALLDILILAPLYYLVYLGYVDKSLVLLLIYSIISILYKPLMEGIWGATLGKMIMKIKMVDIDLDLIGLGQSLLKNVIYIISGVIGILSQFWLANSDEFHEAEGYMATNELAGKSPYFVISLILLAVLLISIFAMFASTQKQTLHDRLANTFCVKNSTFDE